VLQEVPRWLWWAALCDSSYSGYGGLPYVTVVTVGYGGLPYVTVVTVGYGGLPYVTVVTVGYGGLPCTSMTEVTGHCWRSHKSPTLRRISK